MDGLLRNMRFAHKKESKICIIARQPVHGGQRVQRFPRQVFQTSLLQQRAARQKKYADSETQAAEECLSRLDVPAEWDIPDGDCRYDCIIKDNCEMLLFWHTPDQRLYIVQNLV